MIHADTKVTDVIDNPLFAGYGRLIFPTAFGRPSASMTLDEVGSLLIYHNYVNTDTTIDVIREMGARRKQGEKIFYDIYTEQEKRRDPEKRDTGLFFFRGGANAPFAVICAGGGFYYVGSIHESLPHALELSRMGYNGFALVYRTRTADTACEDLARAIRFIFDHAKELGVDTRGYSLWDGIADWRVMKRRLECLEAFGTDTEFHLYPGLRHGFGLGIGTEAEGWINDAVAFWERNSKRGGVN